MSQSRESEEGTRPQQEAKAQRDLSRMMSTGRSFSGREKHCAFLNLGDGSFATVSSVTGLDLIDDGRAVVRSDWDRDGDADLWISNRTGPQLRYLRNDSPRNHHFLSLRLEGNGTSTNRDAIGARVELVREGEKPQIATVRAGEGFLSKSSKWLDFGLGASTRIDTVVVRWPNGAVETFVGLAADQRWLLRQGMGRALPVPPIAASAGPPPADPPVEERSDEATLRIPMGILLPAGTAPILDFTGRGEAWQPTKGRATLLSLWASWCPPCLSELKDLSEHRSEIERAGIDVIALAVNGLGDDQSDPAEAERFRSEIDFPFRAARATPAMMAKLQAMHDLQMTYDTPLPVPTNILIDPQGRIAILYKGALRIDDLLADVAGLATSTDSRWPRTAARAGRIMNSDVVGTAARRNELALKLHFAQQLDRQNAWDESIPLYREAVDFAPDNAVLRGRLGVSLARAGRFAEAEPDLQRAVDLDPTNAAYWNDLGSAQASRGDLGRAAQSFAAAVRLDPSLVGARNNLDRARQMLEQPKP